MKKEILRKIGLTDGEIRVYFALIKLGKSSTGPIMEHSGISSSKVYLILEKLIQKGFASYIIEDGVKKFHATNPENIIEYIEKQQKELEKEKQEAKELVKQLSKIDIYKEESAKIYKGTKSMKNAYDNILNELKKGEEFLFIGGPVKQKKSLLFFQNLHKKRIERKIKTKGIGESEAKKPYMEIFKKMKNIELKFMPIAFPHAIAIGKKRVVLSLWEENPLAIEIISERMTQRYKKFFYQLWKQTKN